MESIGGLIHSARGPSKYAKFEKGGYTFSAKEVRGRVSVYVNGVRRSREYADILMGMIKNG